jgi:hypothetical protein
VRLKPANGRRNQVPLSRFASFLTIMLQDKKTKTNIGVGLGILIQLLHFVLVLEGYVSPTLGLMIEIVGLVIFTWGCMNYAEVKGYSKWLGLVGLLSCIGLLVLVFVPDRNQQNK